jgi:hypothetical protein
MAITHRSDKSFRLQILVRALSIALLIIATSGCSTVYNQKWNKAAKNPDPSSMINGRWQGKWLSDRNQHTGKLRCIVTQKQANLYDFHYWATWSIFAGAYHVEFAIQETNNTAHFAGSKDLGKLAGGLYQYEGNIEGDVFRASYDSKYDEGMFELSRVP